MSTMIGELIDHYRISDLIGRGAMGAVYKALDVNLDRWVAIKVMGAEVRSDPAFVERFRQEARLQGALNHPNVAMLFDYFVHDGAPVAVMELIEGESLEQLIRRRGAIPAHESLPIFKQALRAVAAAHRAGIIHRDLKPSNLMITKEHIVKVMDFGIAKRQGATGATQVSTSVGTVLYMAPEQILGRTIDCRTDVYGLGTTLYELLSGQPPFSPQGKAPYMVLNAHVNDLPQPPTVHCRHIPQRIVEAVMRALAKDPNARFQNVDEFMRALPDVPAPEATAPPVAASDTVAFEYSPPTGGDAVDIHPRSGLERSGTLMLEHARSAHRNPYEAMSPSAAAATAQQGPMPHPRGGRPRILAGVLVAILVIALGTLVGYRQLHATLRNARVIASETPLTDTQASTAMPTPTPTPTSTPPPTPAQPDLSGTWRGEYVDGSGKQLLRVVSLSISRVYEDGGIEGTLQYEAASGEGECSLHPRGSNYSAGERRLQLSPEGCSAHYPRELSVPVDFDGVNPRANTLRDGRIEAPTGELISVKLKRVSEPGARPSGTRTGRKGGDSDAEVS